MSLRIINEGSAFRLQTCIAEKSPVNHETGGIAYPRVRVVRL